MLSPSSEAATALLRSYATRKRTNNGGEQEVWANHHTSVYELPIGYNAHRGLEMSEDEWRQVRIVHAISGHQVNRLPTWLHERMQSLELNASRIIQGFLDQKRKQPE